MTPEQVSDLVTQIRSGVMWAQLPTFLITIALVGVLIYFNRRLSSFASKTGEIEAITSKFEQLTAQLKSNTETVEGVRTEIAHGDWVAREWKALRRQKLEQLLENVFAITGWQEVYRLEKIFQSKISAGDSPITKIELIGLLYFPELRDFVFSFCQIHGDFVVLTLEYGQRLIQPVANYEVAILNKDVPEAKRAANEASGIRDRYTQEHLALYKRQLVAKSLLEQAARDVFLTIVGMHDKATMKLASGSHTL